MFCYHRIVNLCSVKGLSNVPSFVGESRRHFPAQAASYSWIDETEHGRSEIIHHPQKEIIVGLPRTFVGFSSTDIRYYRLIQAWKANKNIDFNFTDCQLHSDINSVNETYIKQKCWERINMAGKYVLLIGQDTKSKHKYVRWEAEVAIEKECTIIGVNLDGSRSMVKSTCPPIIRDIGAIFVPFSPQIVAYAIENYEMPYDNENYHYKKSVYRELGY